MQIKKMFARTLERIRNPKSDESETAFTARLSFLRLLFFLPFLIAAVVFFLLGFD